MPLIAEYKQIFRRLFFPERSKCPVCGRYMFSDEALMCSGCYDRLEFIGKDVCYKCSKDYKDKYDKRPCCSEMNYHFDKGISLCFYEKTAKRIIRSFKSGNDPDTARECGKLLAKNCILTDWFDDVDLITCVPIGKEHLLKRGYNQAKLLTESFKYFTQIKIDSNILSEKEGRLDQIGLNFGERCENMIDAFELRDKCTVDGKNILVIDDVFTSGATLNACSKALKDGGALRVYFATFATTKL